MASNAIVVNGTVNTLPTQNALAGAGQLFVTNCQTPGTAIAYAALTAFSATANGLFVISNGAPSGGKNIFVHRLELFQTAAVATGTTWSFEAYSETGIVAGTTAVITRTPVQVNAAVAQTSVATVQAFNAGAITIPSAVGTRRLVGQWWLPIGVNVVKDVYTIDFGSDAPAASKTGLTAARATDVARCTAQGPAIVIPPQTTTWINLWGCGTAAPSFEYNLIHSEL
jgi:hypothetical protein